MALKNRVETGKRHHSDHVRPRLAYNSAAVNGPESPGHSLEMPPKTPARKSSDGKKAGKDKEYLEQRIRQGFFSCRVASETPLDNVQLATQTVRSKTRQPVNAKALKAELAAWHVKERELRALQLLLLQAQAALKSVEARADAQEVGSGGIGALDLEQLQLEKASLSVRLASREHEMGKFLAKRREAVQILAHVSAKLEHERTVQQKLQEKATGAASHLTEQRTLASTARAAVKQVVDKARQQQDLDVTLRDPKLVENYKAQLLRREQLQVTELLAHTVNGTEMKNLGAATLSFVSEGTSTSPRRDALNDSQMATTIQPFIRSGDKIAAIMTA
ncbi:hypothetical protein WJX73_009503 [Symbiochloris irregularis]|uniref:CCDC113/CCDC96 coiled-coil domain-containing protein n=1 Tax=Symbiochloris irregularis TaxID=706552 RepID=A0AAW1NSC8_9CHLO